MAAEYLDRIKLGLSRVAQQYQESPKFLAWLEALLALEQNSEDTLQAMALQTDIDIATGVNLYTIATIVGAPIVYTSDRVGNFIGFKDQEHAFPFWDDADPSVEGGRWRENNESELAITDLWAAQRLVIRCEIVKNHSDGSGESIQRGLMFLFPNVPCIVTDNKNMTFSIGIGRHLSDTEEQLLLEYDILPRPAGVDIDQIVAFDEPYFGFEHHVGDFGAGGEEGTFPGWEFMGEAKTFDVGMWANLSYWREWWQGTRAAPKHHNLLLIPTTR